MTPTKAFIKLGEVQFLVIGSNHRHEGGFVVSQREPLICLVSRGKQTRGEW